MNITTVYYDRYRKIVYWSLGGRFLSTLRGKARHIHTTTVYYDRYRKIVYRCLGGRFLSTLRGKARHIRTLLLYIMTDIEK